MIGGGEEYFAPPEEIDVDTIQRFASLSQKLRQLEKAGSKVVAQLAEEAEAVGTSMAAKEIVAGLIYRCITTYSGNKQLCYWYLLDKLAKDKPDTFGHLFGMHLLDVACDCMPWEDPNLYSKLESLVEHWDGVFPRNVVDRIYLARKERQWAARHPLEAAEIRQAEEKKWAEVEKQYQEADGLDFYEQPCLAYMQGHCPWGNQCTLFHPEGLEGTLPAETRLGDWRCAGCGVINRHFRRRCFSCPRERPQYRKDGSVKTLEEQALSHPDPEALAALRQPLGYNPISEKEAVEYWKNRFTHEPVSAFIEARRLAYLSKILPAAKAGAATSGKGKRPLPSDLSRHHAAGGGGQQPLKAHRSEGSSTAAGAATAAAGGGVAARVKLPEVPELPPPDRVLHICQRVIDRGAQDADFPGYLYLLCKTLPEAARDAKWTASKAPEDSLALHECAKRVFASWSLWNATAGDKSAMHPAMPFFADVRKYLGALPLTAQHRGDMERMCAQVLQK
jgi:hypothetical protein